MHRQTGDLVNPGLTKETQPIYLWLVENVSTETAVNVMFQYHPSHRVGLGRFRNIDRRLTMEEMLAAKESAAAAGLTRLL